ncbi:MAG: GDP-mannose 4,6-dehydratase [Elusimicrobia bacterium]|nr:GDP-mannose 4,6-dehydratase [Elusimicrobiota bacterium]
MTAAQAPKRTLVTGGAGFIGSHLVERLLDDGHHVTVVDDLSTGRLENLAAVRAHPRLSVRRADVARVEEIRPLFAGAEWVFHLAALADVVPSIAEPLKYHRANVDGTAAVLEAARAAGAKRLVYAASSSCYGLAETLPTPESAPMRPMYPYALTKWIGEQYVLHWARTYKLSAVSLRLFNVYGPRARTAGTYGAVFGVFLAQKLAGKPFTVVGDGEQTRDFTYVADAADAFAAAAACDASGEAFNVGSGSTYSVNELVRLLGGPAVRVPKRPGEPDATFADISRIKARVGWSPKVGFAEGVARVLENIEQWRGAPVWDAGAIREATKEWFQYLS